MNSLGYIRIHLQEKWHYGEPLRHGMRRAGNHIWGLLRVRGRNFRLKWQKRLQPRRLWSHDAWILKLRESGVEKTHGIRDFREICAPVPVPTAAQGALGAFLAANYPPPAPLLSRRGFVCQIDNAHLHPAEGLLVTRHNALLLDSAFAPYRFAFSRIYGLPVSKTTQFLPGRYASIRGLFDFNTFHWLIDALPRLHSLELTWPAPLTLLMPECATPYQIETLRYLVPENWKIETIASHSWFEIETLHFASYLSRGGCVSLPPSHTTALRHRVWERLELDPNHVGVRKIFISRRRANWRHLLNEDEAMEALQPLGFERFDLENLDFADQVRLFHDAEIVVGLHGAGLANILFSPRVQVVEILPFPPLPHYFFLAQTLGHPYTAVDAPGRQSGNVLVSVPELQKAVARIHF